MMFILYKCFNLEKQKMSICMVLQEWQKITKQKQITLEAIQKILRIQYTKFAGAPHKNPQNLHQTDHKENLQLQNQTEEQMYGILMGLRNQLWKINEQKRSLMSQRGKLIEQKKNLTLELQMNSEISEKTSMKTKKSRNFDKYEEKELEEYLKLLRNEYKQKEGKREMIAQETQQIEKQLVQIKQQQELQNKKKQKQHEEFMENREINTNKQIKIQQMKASIKQRERQIIVQKQRQQRLIKQCHAIESDAQGDKLTNEQIIAKISKMEEVSNKLKQSYIKWISCYDKSNQNLNKQQISYLAIKKEIDLYHV